MLLFAFPETRLAESLLYGVGWFDPLTFASVVSVLLAASGLAALIASLRATRLDPAAVLR